MTPKMTSCRALAPVARTPSTGPGVDRLDSLGEELGEHPGGTDEQRQHAGERAQADGDHEEHGEDHLVDRTAGIHHPPHRLVDPPGHDVLGSQDRQRDGADDRQHRAPEGDLHGDQHLAEVELPVAEVRREEVGGEGRHVAGVAEQHGRVHFRALPGPGEDGEEQAPADQASPGWLAGGGRRGSGAQSAHIGNLDSGIGESGGARRRPRPGWISRRWRRFSARARPCVSPAWPAPRRGPSAWRPSPRRRGWRCSPRRCAA